jgi:hypothetical protein
MPKTCWYELKEKINHIKKKTSIGNSRLSNGAKIINNMIKRTEISQQKTPTVTKNKASYSNKGLAPLKTDAGTFKADASPKPGMGKGKSRGMGAAEFGGKFSGIY